MIAVENDRRHNVKFFKLLRFAAEIFTGSTQGHFDISRPGIDDGARHSVIRQPRLSDGVEHIFPSGICTMHAPTQQRMDAVALDRQQTLTGS